MTIKTNILAAAAVFTLAVPAIASAQPFDGHDRGRAYSQDYGRGYGHVDRRDDFRRFEREREWRRIEYLRRLQWEREHAYRTDGWRYGYR